jgi:cytochrome c oxidase subunit I+III
VYTYPEELGIGALNFISTVGAFVLALGVACVVLDMCWSPRRKHAPRNPWAAGTLEWLALPKQEPWGVRCVPLIESRYPIWDQPGFVQSMDEGRYFLPDAEEGKRELVISTVLDAEPIQVARVGSPTVKPMLAALALGGVFIFPAFGLYPLAAASAVAALGIILWWLWTGTSVIPEKPAKPAGRGLVLPLYASGAASAGWWAMVITMTADATAFTSLVFGYFFFWTIHADFPPPPAPGLAGPGIAWPMIALGAIAVGWALTVAARALNARGRAGLARSALAFGAVSTAAGGAAGLMGPFASGLEPTLHVYPAIVWVLAIWIAAHAAVGVIMQLYALARSAARKLTQTHDADLRNVTVYQHFLAASAAVTFVVLAFFPVLA